MDKFGRGTATGASGISIDEAMNKQRKLEVIEFDFNNIEDKRDYEIEERKAINKFKAYMEDEAADLEQLYRVPQPQIKVIKLTPVDEKSLPDYTTLGQLRELKEAFIEKNKAHKGMLHPMIQEKALQELTTEYMIDEYPALNVKQAERIQSYVYATQRPDYKNRGIAFSEAVEFIADLSKMGVEDVGFGDPITSKGYEIKGFNPADVYSGENAPVVEKMNSEFLVGGLSVAPSINSRAEDPQF